MNFSISIYRDYFNLSDATFEHIVHDDTMIADVYRVTQSDGTQYILKICPKADHYKHELFFLTYFANTLPVPRILNVMEPTAEHHGALLMECLPGSPVTIYEVTNMLAYDMGSLLARIHSNRTSGYGDLIYPETLQSDPRDAFAIKFEKHFAECRQYLPHQLLDQYWSYYKEHLDLLSGVDGPCITHRDFRPGNIIVHNRQLQGIIDWSGGRAGFAQEDFSSMEHGEWSKDAVTKEAFLSGYASIRPVPDYAKIMPLLRIGRALAVVGYFLKNKQQGDYENNQWYIFNLRFLETYFPT